MVYCFDIHFNAVRRLVRSMQGGQTTLSHTVMSLLRTHLIRPMS